MQASPWGISRATESAMAQSRIFLDSERVHGKRPAMPSLRQIRLATGLVLYAYVTLHFANHALGNISIAAMQSGLAVQKLIWRSPPGSAALYASFLTHGTLGFWALFARRR